MTRRSPLHQRYQSKKPKGSTSRSAASAKPSRDAGKSAAKPTASSGGEGKRWGPPMPTTPESKRLRRIWWGLVIGALAFAVVSIFIRRNNPYLWWPVMAAYAVCLGGAMYLEFFPLRKMRREAEEEMRKTAKSGKGGKTGR